MSDAQAQRQYPGVPFSLGLELDGAGAHPASWVQAGVSPRETLASDYLARQARTADRAGFSYITIEDAPIAPDLQYQPGVSARLDAGVRAAYVAPLTGTIGLVPVVDAIYTEPFHLQGQLASLDILSGGRAGWIVFAEDIPEAAAAIGFAPASGTQIRPEAQEVIAVSRLLWDSWEDDAVIRDTGSGSYFDRELLHHVRFESERFSVAGPAITPRPIQGHPVVFGRAGSVASVALDAVLVTGGDPAALAAEVRAQQAETTPLVILELEVVLDSRGEFAVDRLAKLDAVSPWCSQRNRFVGSPEELVTKLAELSERVDGVRILPAVLDRDLAELERAVLPILREAGIFASPRLGQTLRETLGLERPVNVFEASVIERKAVSA